jgi:hypothetical protein
VLLFFSLALVLNVNASSATSVNQININSSVGVINNTSHSNNMVSLINQTNISTTSVDVINSVSKNTSNSNLISNSNIKNDTVLTNKTDLNKTMAAGAPIVTTNPVLVNNLTMAQLKDGLSRAQAFYVKNGCLPNYVSFGNRHISITTFEQNLATPGLSVTVKPNTSSVAALAKSLAVGSTSKYMTAVRIFDWVRDYISYSFYYDTKYGAAGTLKMMTGNCVDTSSLLIALARDDGITARYVHGYCDFESGWYGHVWTQLYVNGKWYNADATSYSNSLGVIKNWNTTTYKLEGIYNIIPF